MAGTALDIVRHELDQFGPQLEVALPEGMSVEKFTNTVDAALIENPALVTADRTSLFAAVVKCARDGLLPDGREAAIVAFKGKAEYIAMVYGIRKRVADFGWSIRGAVIYEHDEFTQEEGAEPKLIHRPPPLGQDRGKMIGAYAIARHRDGRVEQLVMDAAWIERVRAASPGKAGFLWTQWPERAWEKTPVRRLAKELPLSETEKARILALLDETPAADDPVALMFGDRPALAAAPEGEHTPQAAPSPHPPGEAGGSGTSVYDQVNAAPEPASEDPGETFIPGGAFAGRTISDAASDPAGDAWLRAVLADDSPVPRDDPFRMAVAAYFTAQVGAEAA